LIRNNLQANVASSTQLIDISFIAWSPPAEGDSEADISPPILLGDAQVTPACLFGAGKTDVVTVQGKRMDGTVQKISISIDSGSECAVMLCNTDSITHISG
jgi:hypothetical protein